MTSKTTNKFAPEVRERGVRMVFDYERDYTSKWASVVSNVKIWTSELDRFVVNPIHQMPGLNT